MRKRTRITKGGQISIPAPVRHRWATTAVTVDDQGDRLVVEPAPEDPVDAVAGIWAEYFQGVDLQDLRDDMRREEQEAEDRKLRLHGLEPEADK